MKNRLLLLGLLTLVLVVPIAALTSSQQEGETSPADIVLDITGVNASELPTVILNVNIFDSFGQSVTDLTVEDFQLGGTLAEDAQIVSVENVLNDNLSISVVLVIDASSSMTGPPIQAAKDAATIFVQSLDEQDSVALVTFSSRVTLLQDFTTNKQVLLDAINGIQAEGQTALYDASVFGVLTADSAPTDRRTVILLSDGAEYGTDSAGNIISPSRNERGEALRIAEQEGVSLFTIGLGYGIDRSYLQELTAGTGARAYESPTPEQLPGIYAEIAALLTSQYIITLNADVPLDGTEYTLTLQAETPRGVTTEDTATLRAPIPVPLVRVPPPPTEPLTESASFTFGLLADDRPLSIDTAYTPDLSFDEAVGDDAFTLSVDPRHVPPGDVTLMLTVTDSNGDMTEVPFTFSIASLPSEFTFTGLQPGQVIEGRFGPADTLDLGVQVGYNQTSVQSVEFAVDGVPFASVTEAPYAISIPVLTTFQDGEHTISATVITESGEQTAQSINFSVGIIPTETPTPTSTHTPTVTPSLTPTATFTPSPTIDFEATRLAGTATEGFIVTTTAEAESTLQAVGMTQTAESEGYAQATQAEIDAQATRQAEIIQFETATAHAQATEAAVTQAALDQQATLDASQAQNATAISSALENLNNLGGTREAEQQATLDAVSEISENITATAQAFAQAEAENATATAEIEATDAFNQQATLEAQATLNAQATLDADAITEAAITEAAITEAAITEAAITEAAITEAAITEAAITEAAITEAAITAVAQVNIVATEAAETTLRAQTTLDAEATLSAEQTAEALLATEQAEASAEAVETVNAGLTETAVAEVTEEPTDTLTPQPSATPIEELIEVETGADSEGGDNFAQLLPFAIGGAVLLFILLLLLFGRGRRETPPTEE